jgi:hypothetical protein
VDSVKVDGLVTYIRGFGKIRRCMFRFCPYTTRSSLHARFQESSRAEERLRALFVASDVDGDGDLDFQVQ